MMHMGTKHNLLLKVVSADLRKLLVDEENKEKAKTSGKHGNDVDFITPNHLLTSEADLMITEDADEMDLEPPQLQIQSTASLAKKFKPVRKV